MTHPTTSNDTKRRSSRLIAAESSTGTAARSQWMGIDVGGRRKRFDAALVDANRVLGLRRRQSVDDVVAWVRETAPGVVAIDSPRSTALPGATHRPDERALARSVCGIRWTRWHEPRAGRPRAAWTTEALAALGLAGVPSRTTQDARDAIAAAVTARDYDHGRCEAFGEIVVPASTS